MAAAPRSVPPKAPNAGKPRAPGKGASVPAKANVAPPAPQAAKPRAPKPKAVPEITDLKYTFDIGQMVEFIGYPQGLPEGSEAVFTTGQYLKVVGHTHLEDVDSEEKVVSRRSGYICVDNADEAEYLADPDGFKGVGEVLSAGQIKKVKLTGDEVVTEIIEVGRLSEIFAENGNDPEATIKSLQAAMHGSEFYLGGAIAKTRAQRLYETSHPLRDEKGQKIVYKDASGKEVSAFAAWLNDKIGMGLRTGQNYIQTYEAFSRLPNFDPESISALPFYHQHAIAKAVTPENFDALVTEASNVKDSKALADLIKSKYTVSETTASSESRPARARKIRTRVFNLSTDEVSGAYMEAMLTHLVKASGTDPVGVVMTALSALCSTLSKNARSAINKASRDALASLRAEGVTGLPENAPVLVDAAAPPPAPGPKAPPVKATA